MLTPFSEVQKDKLITKCHNYWTGVSYVEILEEQEFNADFHLKRFQVSNEKETLIVDHYHLKTWPDHGTIEGQGYDVLNNLIDLC